MKNLVISGNDWTDVNAASGFAVGQAIAVQSLSSNTLIVIESDTKPLAMAGARMKPMDWWQTSTASKKLWVYPVNGSGEIFVEVL